MTDINAVILKYKGWKSQPDGNNTHSWYQYDESEKVIDVEEWRPDYWHDVRLYMALAEEMKCMICYNRDTKKWLVYQELADPDCDSSMGSATDLGTAICLAYMRLHGLE